MTAKEHGFAKVEDVKATIWRIRETIRVGELATTHRLRQMRRLLMHEEHKICKREFGFDLIDMVAEMDEKRCRTSTSPAPDPYFYRKMVIPKHPHTPDEFTLEPRDESGRRTTKDGSYSITAAPQPQRDLSPGRAAVYTGSEEPGTPPRSPAIMDTSVFILV